jgi:hypothetical protein
MFQFIGMTPMFAPVIEQLPDILSMLYDLFIKSEGKKVQKIEIYCYYHSLFTPKTQTLLFCQKFKHFYD